MSESIFLNEANDRQKNEFARKLDYFRNVDSDLHHSFINHISIGITVAISIVVLIGLYVVAAVSMEYGGAIYELANSNIKYTHDSKTLLLFGMLAFIFSVVVMSVFCFRFLVKLRRELIKSAEEAFLFRKSELGGRDDR